MITRNQSGSLKALVKSSLKHKLVTAFIPIGMIPMLITACIAVWQSHNNITNQAYSQLESLRDSKIQAVENYSDTIIQQVLTLSSSRELIDGIQKIQVGYEKFLQDSNDLDNVPKLKKELSLYYRNEFLRQFKELNEQQDIDVDKLLDKLSPEAIALQHAYIYNNSASLGNKDNQDASSLNTNYDAAHALIHPSLRKFLKAFGYYDIFLVDNEQGRVVYSVFKELDYATSLINGPFADTGLAEAFKQANQLTSNDEFILLDYAPYLPSYASPASFIATPIFDGNKKVGALIFQMPLDKISAIMNTRSGMGETGEAYLVGSDGLLRSDSYKNPKLYSVETSFKKNIKIVSETIRKGIAETGVLESKNYAGTEVLSSYGPVSFGPLNWALVVDIEAKEAFASLNRIKFQIAGLSLIVVIILVMAALKFAKGIAKPIEAMRKTMVDIITTGDFSRRVAIASNDEIGQSADSFNDLLNNLEKTIHDVNEVVSGIAQGDFSRRVISNVHGDLEKLKNSVNTSADSIDKTMDSLNELMDALVRGDFKRRMTSELKGEFNKFGQHVNRSMQSIDDALSSIHQVMSMVAKGNLDSRVENDLPGQLGEMKTNLNSSLDMITKVFSATGRVLEAVSHGNLNESIADDFEGAFEKLKKDANATVAKLTEVVNKIQQASASVNIKVASIAEGNNNLSGRTEKQATNLEETAASMNEITSTVQHTASNANRAKNLACEARECAIHGGDVVKEAVDAMEQISLASNQIAEIIGVIDEIAFQTNLLALNASVEAARAGTEGRGFAVVANEVRNLAERSATAAKEIKELIEDSVQKVQCGSKLVTRSGETLSEIVNGVEKVTTIVGEISTAADEQSLGVNQVHQAMGHLQSLTSQNAAMAEEATAASEDLAQQAKELYQLVAFFSASEQASDAQKISQTETQLPFDNDHPTALAS